MMDETKIEEQMKKIDAILGGVEREGMEAIRCWLMESDFYKAPAASKKQYHCAYAGGLAEHSLNVYTKMLEWNTNDKLGFDPDSITIVGLFHDVCKANKYVPNILKTTGVQSDAVPYKINDSFDFGHGEKSAYLLAILGFKMSKEEAMAIRYHMGPYDELGAWKINGKMNRLADLCFSADNYCSKLIENIPVDNKAV